VKNVNMNRLIKYEEGQQIGIHSYLKEVNIGKRLRHALFACGYCGTHFTASIKDIKAAKTRSCGCIRNKWAITHGQTIGRESSPEYATWCRIKNRCYNPNVPEFNNYGGRGIKMSEEWLNSFELFLAHVGLRPSSKHSIDRYPDNDGNYEAGNVRWATKRRNLKELCDKRGLNYRTMHRRIFDQKMEVHEALTKPTRTLKNKSNFIAHSFGNIN
jgi:hypothetical protein